MEQVPASRRIYEVPELLQAIVKFLPRQREWIPDHTAIAKCSRVSRKLLEIGASIIYDETDIKRFTAIQGDLSPNNRIYRSAIRTIQFRPISSGLAFYAKEHESTISMMHYMCCTVPLITPLNAPNVEYLKSCDSTIYLKDKTAVLHIDAELFLFDQYAWSTGAIRPLIRIPRIELPGFSIHRILHLVDHRLGGKFDSLDIEDFTLLCSLTASNGSVPPVLPFGSDIPAHPRLTANRLEIKSKDLAFEVFKILSKIPTIVIWESCEPEGLTTDDILDAWKVHPENTIFYWELHPNEQYKTSLADFGKIFKVAMSSQWEGYRQSGFYLDKRSLAEFTASSKTLNIVPNIKSDSGSVWEATIHCMGDIDDYDIEDVMKELFDGISRMVGGELKELRNLIGLELTAEHLEDEECKELVEMEWIKRVGRRW